MAEPTDDCIPTEPHEPSDDVIYTDDEFILTKKTIFTAEKDVINDVASPLTKKVNPYSPTVVPSTKLDIYSKKTNPYDAVVTPLTPVTNPLDPLLLCSILLQENGFAILQEDSGTIII